tara:strand:- start:1195 stop:2061 length:867 start_codon:yes stop_codon:yes gene_type:complete
MKIKHSKYKNTGILFELLLRQITSDILEGKDSPVKELLQKYFVKTELGKEYKLYEVLLKKTSLTEGRADVIINSLLESSKTLNRRIIKKQKYNLINELKNHYDLNKLFNHKLPHYKIQAAFYTLLEIYNNGQDINPDYIIQNKITILEHLTAAPIKENDIKNKVLNELKGESKEIQILTYKILLEKFNSKHGGLSLNQKTILQKVIYSVDNRPELKEFYISKSNEIKKELKELSEGITDPVTQIKVKEVISLINPERDTKICDSKLVNMLQYCELIEQLKIANGSLIS